MLFDKATISYVDVESLEGISTKRLERPLLTLVEAYFGIFMLHLLHLQNQELDAPQFERWQDLILTFHCRRCNDWFSSGPSVGPGFSK